MKLSFLAPVVTGVLILQCFLASVSLASNTDNTEAGDGTAPTRGEGRRYGIERVVVVLDWAKSIFR